MATSCVVVGLVAFAWAAMMWKKRRDQTIKWVPFLMVISGLCLGIGIGYLAGISIVQAKIGYFPVWVPFVLIVGFGFFLEIKGWNDHPTRTPVLGFVTALVLMLAVGHVVVSWSGHEINTVRTTSNVVTTGTEGKG
jgi:hypothetical protein